MGAELNGGACTSVGGCGGASGCFLSEQGETEFAVWQLRELWDFVTGDVFRKLRWRGLEGRRGNGELDICIGGE